jgi:oxygen-independent coproporphyrinogen-3 oxidase
LNKAGLPAYEISNHARPGAESHHNLVYWRYGDYLGVGPGAHARLTVDGEKVATRRIRSPEGWLDALEQGEHPLSERTALSRDEQITEMVMMGLRLAEGVPMARLCADGHDPGDAVVDPDRVQDLVEGGFLDPSPDMLRATVAGRQRLDAVLAHLLT